VLNFPGFSGDKATMMAAIFEGLSNALVPTAFGLIVALMSMCFYKYLLAEVEAFDVEMETASLQLMNDLLVLGSRRTSS
jgi:biopolymer transport protein ExbB/TolQ